MSETGHEDDVKRIEDARRPGRGNVERARHVLTVISGPDEAGVVRIGVAEEDEVRVVREYYQDEPVRVSVMRPMPL